MAAYRRFVAEGLELGRRPELVGGGLIRSVGGWSEVKSQRRRGKQELADERILGSGDFVERIIREAEMRIQRQYSGKERGRKVERLIAEECKKRKVSLTELRSGSRRGEIPAVRAEVSRKLVEDCGITIAEIARQVGVSTSAISRAWHAVIPASQQRPCFALGMPGRSTASCGIANRSSASATNARAARAPDVARC